MGKLKCDICGYEFKTIKKPETHYEDYEPYEKMVTYPDPSDENPAHLVRNYVCDNCYQKFGEIIHGNLIAQAEDFVCELHERVEKERIKFEERVQKLEGDTRVVQSICEKLKSIDFIYELTEEDIALIRKYEYSPFRAYYLDDAIRIERSRRLNEKTISEWMLRFNVDFTKLVGAKYSDIVSIYQFREVVKNSILKNCSFSDIQSILSNIDKFIDEHKKSFSRRVHE